MNEPHRVRRALAVVALALVGVSAAGCIGPTSIVPVDQSLPPALDPPAAVELGAVVPTGQPESLVDGLQKPWSVVPLPTGSTLISERDTGRVLELTPQGDVREVGVIPGVVPGGEGGLLGLAARDTGVPYLYAYFTSAVDNRIVRFTLTGRPGSYGLGAADEVLTGIPKAMTHDGGRLLFGPDGMLYATAGDTQLRDQAQQIGSLAGKILRMTPEGDVPADNPFPGSLVYSLGHRNPQGIVFDRHGQLWSSELGQNTWDELNRIEPGANYGWPLVEGIGGVAGFVDPVQQWPTSEASPSGLGIVGDTLFMAALRGKRLWAIDIDDPGVSTAYFVGEYGRMRDAVAGPDGRLWVLTTNTDKNGTPRAGDDHLYAITVAPRP